MGAIVDPDVINQFNTPDPNAPASAPPLTITPGAPITDPSVTQAFDAAPDAPTPAAPAQPSTWKDMARSAGSGLVKGVAAVPGMLGDWADGGEYATSWLMAHGAEKLGLLPEGKTADDFLNDIASNPTLQSAPTGGALNAIANATSLPTSQSTLNAIQNVAGQQLPKPQTAAGQATENVASFIPQSIGGEGNMVRNAIAYGLVPGVTSEAAGQSANAMLGSWADPWARAIGGGLGAMGGHLGIAPAPADHILSGATRGVADADIANARSLQQSAATQGISITPAEAIQQTTGGRSSLGAVQRNLEGMSESAPIMSDYFAQRPQQVQNAASNVFGQIAPYPTSPSGIGVAAQNEAQSAMGQIRQDRTALTSPYYQAAAGDQVPAGRMQAVAQQLDGMIAQHPNNPQLTAPLSDLRQQIVDQPGSPGSPAIPGQRVPVTDPNTGAVIRYNQQPGTPATPATPETYLTSVPQLDQIYGGLRDQYTGPAPLGQSGTDARAGRIAGQGLGLLNDALTDSSPMLAAGRQAHGIATDRWVAPHEAGPLGQISQTNSLAGQGQALYPSNPNVGSQFETSDTVGRLPNTAGAITRNHLETQFNEATQNNMGGANQWGGAKFAAGAFGNPQQAQNLYAGLSALPNGATVSPKVQALADALSATGQRQPMGSQTAYNEQFRDHMEGGTPFGTAASLALSPEKALGFARDWYQQRRIGTNAEALAKALIGPDGFDQIAAARAAVPPEAYRSLVANLLLGRSTVPALVGAQNSSGGLP